MSIAAPPPRDGKLIEKKTLGFNVKTLKVQILGF